MRAQPDPFNWMAASAEPVEFASAWLDALLARLVDIRVYEAAVVLGAANSGPFVPQARYVPHQFDVSPALAMAAEKGLASRMSQTLVAGDSAVWVMPVLLAQDLFGVVLVRYQGGQAAELLRAAWSDLQASLFVHCARMETREREALRERLLVTLDLVMAAQSQGSLDQALHWVVTEVAARLHCDRVSIGFARDSGVRLAALSNTADASGRVDLVMVLQAAMAEAADHGQDVLLDFYATDAGTEAQRRQFVELSRLHREFGSSVVLAWPFLRENKQYGVWLFEWHSEVETHWLELARSLSPVLGHLLLARRHQERPVWQKLRDVTARQARHLVGPAHAGLKLSAVAAVAMLLFGLFATGDFRIAANSALEGGVRRQIVAPYDGFVAQSLKRAGEQVDEGDVLALLDDRDLKLEAQRWASQQEQYVKQTQDAEAQANLAQIQISLAQGQQALAQLKLSESQLLRSRVLAPFSGLVVSGDLSQNLGSAVKKGQLLFEIAPLDSYRVILEVDEADIAYLAEGQTGQLVVAALPGEQFAFRVSLITPVAKTKEGKNYFRVEASLTSQSERLRPGMEGVAKVSIEQARWVWIWTRPALAWLRLKLWTWFGV